jgi:AtzE family amidohydrolase
VSDPLDANAAAFEIADAVRNGTHTAAAIVESTLARIARENPVVNAFTAIAFDRARSKAVAIDAARGNGATMGPLAGVPFGVKAMIDVAGLTTTAGSALHRDDPPAARDAHVVQRLEAMGGICIGPMNMDEFGMGGTTQNATFGCTRNPHDLSRTPGGSSGGSAAGVAAGFVPIALGADGLGSIRLPASLCGVFGLRPTQGVVPRDGPPGESRTISIVGPMARCAHDNALTQDALRDGTDTLGRLFASPVNIAGVRMARAGGYFAERIDPDAADAVACASRALGVVRVVDFPEPQRARAAAILVHASESAVGRIGALRSRLDEFDPLTGDRFLAHALLPAQWYLHAQRFRQWHAAEVVRLLDSLDVLLVPATPCVAPLIGTATIELDGKQVPTGPALGGFTQPLAGTGCPVLTVPIARPAQLPIGVQLLARPGREDLLLQVARYLEQAGVAAAPVTLRKAHAVGG